MSRLAAAAGAGALWGTGALVVALLIGRFGMTPGAISFWRFAIGAVVLNVLFGRALVARASRDRLLRSSLAGAGMAGYVLAWFLGIERLGAAVPTLVALCLPPVLVTLVGIARGAVRAEARLWVVLAAALGGTVLVLAPSLDRPAGSGPDASAAALGVAFALAAAVLYTLVSLLSGHLAVELGAGPSAAAQSLAAVAVTAFAAVAVPLAPPSAPEAWGWLAYLGLATTAVALLAFSWGAARLTPTALTVATLVEPLTAVLLAAVLLGQPLGPVQWAGAALLLGAIVELGRRRPVGAARLGGGSPVGAPWEPPAT